MLHLLGQRTAARALHTTCRRYAARQSLLEQLLRNPELDEQEAKNELRWMSEDARQRNVKQDADQVLEQMVRRRAAGEPLQYILGNTDFGPLTLLARPPTLIPRPETAFVVEAYAERLAGVSRPLRILDLCTGSGCIPLLLSHLLGDRLAAGYGVDLSPEALALANNNIEFIGDERISVFHGDVMSADFAQAVDAMTGGRPIDIITANPPYITQAEWDALPDSVRVYEDRRALVGGPVPGFGDGVAFYARIGELAQQILQPDAELASVPRLAVEIGAEQGAVVSRMLPGRTEVLQDQYGRDRMVLSTL
ncbi:biotin holocarboxylase synthetase [Vanrija albida]|uniref:Biotin holocarboxylase synthetase n=1 Tax=Vanrija albida TaxID=181172 RepID=A0ABR3PVC0_9TREE